MHITKSYKVKIKQNNNFKKTIQLYSNAVWFICDVISKEYEDIKSLSYSNEKYNFIEKLIHTTEKNAAKYKDFDSDFINFPSYYRRAAIATALGKYESWFSNHKNWESEKKGKEPKLTTGYTVLPCFYKDNTFKKYDDNVYKVQIKIFINNSWDFVDIDLKKSDVKYIQRNCFSLKESSPTLQKEGKNYYLRFAYTVETEEFSKDEDIDKVCSVDLGINNVAVCSVVTKEGTVLERKFIKCPREEDSLCHKLNQVKRNQKMGSRENKTLWARINNLNERMSIYASGEIVNFAKEMGCKAIVFEYLNTKGKKRASKRSRLNLWRKRDIQKRVELNAHVYGIRVNRICAFNTSRLAFDGSGEVTRSKDNFSICTFTNGKIYNCDLSASYNIGARYFIRNIQKTTSEKKWLQLVAKVPSVCKRSTCTLSSLQELNKALAA